MTTRIPSLTLILMAAAALAGCGGETEAEKILNRDTADKSDAVVELVDATVALYTDFADELDQLFASDTPQGELFQAMPELSQKYLDRLDSEVAAKLNALTINEQRAYHFSINADDGGDDVDPRMVAVEQRLRSLADSPPGDHDSVRGYIIQTINKCNMIAEMI